MAHYRHLPFWKAALDLAVQLSSFTGHLRHANSHRLWQRTLVQHPWLNQMFGPSRDIRLGVPRWSPPEITNLADQHTYFAKLYPGNAAVSVIDASG